MLFLASPSVRLVLPISSLNRFEPFTGGVVQLCPEKLDLGQLAQTPLASGSSIALEEDLFTGPRSSGKSSLAAGKSTWVA